MAPVVEWIVVALVTAVVVIVVAAMATGKSRHGIRQFVADFRSGIRRAPGAGSVGLFAGAREELSTSADAEEGRIADLFTLGERPEHAYVEPVDLARPIARVTRRTLHLARRAHS